MKGSWGDDLSCRVLVISRCEGRAGEVEGEGGTENMGGGRVKG